MCLVHTMPENSSELQSQLLTANRQKPYSISFTLLYNLTNREARTSEYLALLIDSIT